MKERSPGEKPVIRRTEEPLLRRLLARFTPTASGAGATALAETLATPLLALLLAFWLNPLDPFFLRAQFAWVWLGPVLVALRYGPIPGLAASAIVFGAWFVFGELGVALGELPKLYFLGWLITVMICGEFSSLWRNRVRRAESVQAYLEQRLEYLTHQHYLLRLSHDRLEQDLISRPVSMRDALVSLRALASAPGAAGEALPGAQDLLRLVAQYCQIERAALLPVDANGRPEGTPTHLGAPFDIDAADPLVGFALERRRLAHVALDDERADGGSRYLVVAPLSDMSGAMRALLVVERMPFFALHEETLQMLNLLLGYYADGLSASELAAPLRARFADCPLDFAFEMARMWRVRVESGVASALVTLEFPAGEEGRELALQIARIQRSLDVVWRVDGDDRPRLLTLMPLAGSAAVEGYLARIDNWLRQHRGSGLDDSGVGSRISMLDTQEPAALLAVVLKVRHGQ